MEIRNGGEALKTFLGVSSTLTTNEQPIRRPDSDRMRNAFSGDQATLSHVGTKVPEATNEDGLHLAKDTAVQRALPAGTYSVDATRVAEKVMEAMLGASPEK